MFVTTEKRGVRKPYDLTFYTLKGGTNEHAPGAVSHVVGRKEVTIRSTEIHSFGSIPIKGRNNLRLLRDALIKVCEAEGIK